MSVNLSVNGSRTNAILTSGSIAFEDATATNRFVLGGAVTNIWLTPSGKFAYSTAGSFDHYATIQGRVTDVPMSADGKILDATRLKKYLLPFSNAIPSSYYLTYLMLTAYDIYAGGVGTVTATRTSSAFNPLTGATVGSNVMRTRVLSIGANSYNMPLIEGERTNVMTYSQDFTQWVTVSSTLVPDAIAGIDGTLTGGKIVPNIGSIGYITNGTKTYTAGTTYTYSAYMKAGEMTSGRLLAGTDILYGGDGNGSPSGIYNLETGVATAGRSDVSAEMQFAGNGWYLCSVTFTPTATASYASQVRTLTTGDGSSGIYIWGVQIEVGKFTSSYIKTEASPVTRTTDILKIPTMSKGFTTAGTLMMFGKVLNGDLADRTDPRMFRNFNAVDNLYVTSSTSFRARRNDAIDNNQISSVSTLTNEFFSMTHTWDGGTQKHKLYVDGVYKTETSTETTFVDCTTIANAYIGRNLDTAGNEFDGWLTGLFFDRALTPYEIALIRANASLT